MELNRKQVTCAKTRHER